MMRGSAEQGNAAGQGSAGHNAADQRQLKQVEVVAAVIVKGGTVLATERGYGEFRGKWEFPGGKVEPGETPEDAIVREIREELAATIAVDEYLTTVHYDYPTFHLVMHCYLAHVAEGNLILREHLAARWLGANDISTVDWLPADIEVIGALKQRLSW